MDNTVENARLGGVLAAQHILATQPGKVHANVRAARETLYTMSCAARGYHMPDSTRRVAEAYWLAFLEALRA